MAANGTTPSVEQLMAFIQEQKQQMAAMAAQLATAKANGSHIGCKISDKGALVLTGFGRFPHTFYISQWDRLMADLDKVNRFVADNRSRFATKGE